MPLNRSDIKKFTAFCGLMVLLSQGHSQTQDEWLNQKKKQKEYLLKQIAALKTYVKALDKGYQVVKVGLQTISDIKQGDFNLHSGHLTLLEKVTPSVARYQKVSATISAYDELLHAYRLVKKQAIEGPALTQSEKQYVMAVFSELLNQCYSDVEFMKSIVSNDRWKLSDDQRIRQIDLVHCRVGERLQFARYFSVEVLQLAVSKSREMRGVKNYKTMIGVKD